MSSELFEQLKRLELSNVAAFTSAQVDSALGHLGRLDGWKAQQESLLLNRAATLAAQGSAPDPEDSLRAEQRSSAAEGRKKARRANVAAKTPKLTDAMGDGDITPSHLDAVANAARDLEPEQQDQLFDQANNADTMAKDLSVEAYRRYLARMVDKIRRDEGLDRDAEQRKATGLRKWINPKTGMYITIIESHPELGEALFAGIDAKVEQLWRQSTNGVTDTTVMPDAARRNENLAAHALVSLVTSGHRGPCTSVPEVLVLIDDQTLESGIHDYSVSESTLGTYLPPDTIRRMCCDAKVQPVIRRTDGSVLNVGRSARTANRAQRRALRAMYRSCAFDGCTKSFNWCEVHHVTPWSEFGPTDLDNLIPLCHQHHHKMHEGKWQLKLLPDRTLKTYRPDGTHFSTTDPPKLLETEPATATADPRHFERTP